MGTDAHSNLNCNCFGTFLANTKKMKTFVVLCVLVIIASVSARNLQELDVKGNGTEPGNQAYWNCNGGDSCCHGQCLEGEGDCDYDSDCQLGLLCGDSNCKGNSFDGTDGCCFVQQFKCRGGDSCCRNGICGYGEGDCDSDDDCANGLKCGSNNCRGSGFDRSDDCCE